MLSGSPYNLASGIKATAAALGVNPVDLATAISYETAGTFNPTIAGPKTKWGRHRGLIQFGEPQARQYGVDWNDPIGSQLGPDGAVTKYLRDTGVQPGMGLLDIYSAINAGGVRRYNRSDAAAGGAPGTVADKVTKQMAGHRKKALALLGGDERITPVSSDVTADTKGSPMRSLLGNSGGVNPEMVSLLGLDPAELRRQAIWSGLAQAGAQLAQTGTLAGAAGGFAQGVNQGRENYMQEALLGYRMREDEAERQYREQERQWRMDERTRQAEMAAREEADRRAVIDRLPPELRPYASFPGVVEKYAESQLFPSAPDAPKVETFFDEKTGQQYKAQWDAKTGSWVPVGGSKAPNNGITIGPDGTVQIGGAMPKLTEQQSKDVGFYNRASQVAPLLDSMDENLTHTPSAVGSSIPVAGNFLQKDAYRQATQAGNEFLLALLRKDTGAAVTDGEMILYGGTYLPRAGDDDKTIEQKRAARARAIEGIRMGLGPAEILFQELEMQKQSSPDAPAGGNTQRVRKWTPDGGLQ